MLRSQKNRPNIRTIVKAILKTGNIKRIWLNNKKITAYLADLRILRLQNIINT